MQVLWKERSESSELTPDIFTFFMAVEAAEAASKNVALVFGVTGLVGNQLAKKLLSKPRWKVYGVARKPEISHNNNTENPNYHFISCNLLNPFDTQQKLSSLQDVTHIFWVTWASQFPLDSQECFEQNKDMMCNALNALLPRTINSLKHFSLQTGTKHYVSLQEAGGDGDDDCCYDEDSPRVSSGYNFYYALEDLVKERLGLKVPWSVHRPGLIMGCSRRTMYNFMGTLCVYGTIRRYLNLPFVFGGTRDRWEEMHIDGSDARLVAEEHIWAATNEKAYSSNGQPFNSINGVRFTWKETWPAIGKKFGVQAANGFSPDFKYSTEMAGMGDVWRVIVEKEGLVKTEIGDLANWEFLDVLFRCPVKMLGSREKADRMGFNVRCDTLDSILYWIDYMRGERLIP